jgi:glycosyltransferase involved in cell wall biosynthesis
MKDGLPQTTRLAPMPPYAVAGSLEEGSAPRVLLVSEFFPEDLQHSVYGAFQRLRVLIDAARTLGIVDLLFFWATLDSFSAAEVERRYGDLAAAWGVDGTMWVCRAGHPGRRLAIRERLIDLPWAMRGAIGFFGGRPTMRSCGGVQGQVVRLALRRLKPSLVIAHAQGALAALRRADVPLPPVVVDFPDIDHVRFERAAVHASNAADRLGLRATSILARNIEGRNLRLSRTAMVCSEVDRRQLQRLAPKSDIRVLPNSIDELPHLPLPDQQVVLFVATFRYPPNVEAALWLVGRCWPQISARLPAARLLIVGEGGPDLRQRVPPQPGVEFLGFLDSLQEAYAAARLVVCPIGRGSGTRIKIIEAAAYGRPVVATAVGAEGLEFVDGREILIRDQPDTFAQACITLLGDMAMSQNLGQSARVMARARYGRAAAVTAASLILSDAMAAGPIPRWG